jgi:hypothetical protein
VARRHLGARLLADLLRPVGDLALVCRLTTVQLLPDTEYSEQRPVPETRELPCTKPCCCVLVSDIPSVLLVSHTFLKTCVNSYIYCIKLCRLLALSDVRCEILFCTNM